MSINYGKISSDYFYEIKQGNFEFHREMEQLEEEGITQNEYRKNILTSINMPSMSFSSNKFTTKKEWWLFDMIKEASLRISIAEISEEQGEKGSWKKVMKFMKEKQNVFLQELEELQEIADIKNREYFRKLREEDLKESKPLKEVA